jgi:regulator of sigma E protease
VSWLYTFIGFAALIILHEAGHFVAAKAVGMRVDRFSLFFGPLLVKFRRGETEYGIGPIPLGGYVKIFGMNPYELERRGTQRGGALRSELGVAPRRGQADADPQEGDDAPPIPPELAARAFFNQPVWKRVVVIAAGPAVNVVVAFLIIWVVYLTSAQVQVGQPRLTIQGILAGSPSVGLLHAGDVILGADGKPVNQATLPRITASHACPGNSHVNGCRAATPVRLLVQRGSRRVTVAVYPRYDASAKTVRMGFEFAPVYDRYATAGTGQAASLAISRIGSITGTTVSKVSQVFVSSQARSQLNSIVGASDVVQQSFSYSAANAFFVLAVISLSLAVVNLFPFLPLDGGHIFWAVAEKVRGRRIPFAVMERASMVGIALVLFLFVVGFTNDIHTLTGGGFKVH